MCAHHDDVPAGMVEEHGDVQVIRDADLHHHEPRRLDGSHDWQADRQGVGHDGSEAVLTIEG